jgi:hypothetical protein
MKFSVHTGAKFDDKAPDLARWPFQRPSVLKQIEKLARTTDYQLQEDYQWLCNAVHPSVGGMLSFTAPLLAHEKKTHAFHVVCEDPTRLRLGEKVPELKRTRLPKCEGAPLGAGGAPQPSRMQLLEQPRFQSTFLSGPWMTH